MDSETAEEIKRHFDIVAGGLRTEIRAVAQETQGLRAEIQAVAEGAEETRRHFNVIGESLRTDIRTVAEGFIGTNDRLDRFETRVYEEFGELRMMIRLSFDELDQRIQAR
jgi:hypothetical protein